MRITIEIDGASERRLSVAADTSAASGAVAARTESFAASSGLGAGEATDAGPPANGLPLGAPADAAIGGQAINAGAAPPAAGSGAPTSAVPSDQGGSEDLIDAGRAPELG